MLFDWRGTLDHIPRHEWFAEHTMASIGRRVDPDAVSAIVTSLRAVAGLPEFVQAALQIDCSAAIHRTTSKAMFEQAGIDDELADALYALDFDATSHPVYPDVRETLTSIRDLGVKSPY